MAIRTAEALIGHLEDGREVRSVRLETQLIIRRSSGSPARAAAVSSAGGSDR